MPYWWDNNPSECYWIEIRHIEGIGRSLTCPTLDEGGGHNAWYDLVERVAPGDVVYHWNAQQHRFVGRSEVAGPVVVSRGRRSVPLRDFTPLRVPIDLSAVRADEAWLRGVRDRLHQRFPTDTLYLPFQYRADGIRFMSNYFAKLPKEVVERFFDATGLGEASAAPPPSEEGPAGTPDEPSTYGFLAPFRSKQDTWYQVHVVDGVQRRSRRHETLVNRFATWLQGHGVEHVGRNAVIDLGVANPPVIIEAKVIASGWAGPIREAVGQLYEYRFFQVADPNAGLVFLADHAVPQTWVRYLERDRGIGIAWAEPHSFALTNLARSLLQI